MEPYGTDLPPVLYVHAWPEAPYFIRRNLLVAFGLPLLSRSLYAPTPSSHSII